jgi:membrane protease YdiL (CAAX protease family)
MFSGLFKNSSPFVKILFSLFCLVLGYTIFALLGIILSIIFFGTSFESIANSLNHPDASNVQVLKFLQACFSIGMFIFPPILIAWFLHGKIGVYLKLNKKIQLNALLLAILLVLFSMPLINFLIYINQNISFPESLKGFEVILKKMESEAQKTTEVFLAASSIKNYLVNLLIIALIPALGEEFLFRGTFQRLFHEWFRNIHFAIFLSAFIFSSIHFQFYGFFPRLVLGILFGYLFYWSGNLWLPVIAHFFNNAFAVTLIYMKSDLARKAENFGTGSEMVPSVIISALLLSIILYQLYKMQKKIPDLATMSNEEKMDEKK